MSEFRHKAVPCPVCHTQAKQDYFADLRVYEGNEQGISSAKEFAANPSGWLVIGGGVGSGKTRLLNAILSTWRGQQRQALTAAELLDYWRRAMDTDTLGPVFNQYCVAPAALVDDLGSERPTAWSMERLPLYLDIRYNRRLPTVIATNLDRAGMVEHLGERLADRVFDQGTGLVRVVSLNVPSFRRA